ncbi:reverse transcriptase domain-containing protein [Tanacetum coccineum]
MRFPDIPSTSIKLMLFPFSLEGSARIWLEKEPPRSILTWDDLVSKFINQFFPPSKTTNLRNEITRFQQRFDESFYEAWDRFNDLLRACPHHGFSELHQLDTFYNALNANDQDSLNSAAGGNFLDKMPRECLKIIESKSKVRNSRNKAVVAKVSSNSSTLGISPDVAALTTEVSELKNMMKTMLIDKLKQQSVNSLDQFLLGYNYMSKLCSVTKQCFSSLLFDPRHKRCFDSKHGWIEAIKKNLMSLNELSLNLPGQEEGINFEESFAPCRLRGYKDFYRVCCSYEHGRLPNGCEDCLKKALYGLKQAPRAWYDMLSSFLISQDFSKGSVDPTLFIRREGKELLLISQSPRDIFINQSKYALESLKKYGFDSCDLMDTPMVEKSKLDEDKKGKPVNCVLWIFGLYTSRLLDVACKKVLNLLKKGLLKVEAMPESAWIEKDQIDNFLIERRLMRSLEMILKDGGEDFRYSDTERLSRSDEVLKLKNFKKDATLKLSKSTNQEWYKHVGPEVTRSQMTKSQDGEMRLCLVDDLTVLKITSPLTSKDKGTS